MLVLVTGAFNGIQLVPYLLLKLLNLILGTTQSINSYFKDSLVGTIMNVIWLIFYIIFVKPFLVLGEYITISFLFIITMYTDLATDLGGGFKAFEQMLESIANDKI